MAKAKNTAKSAAWVAVEYHPYKGMTLACSSCKKQFKHDIPNPKSCPNCHAEMTNSKGVPRGWVKAHLTFKQTTF